MLGKGFVALYVYGHVGMPRFQCVIMPTALLLQAACHSVYATQCASTARKQQACTFKPWCSSISIQPFLARFQCILCTQVHISAASGWCCLSNLHHHHGVCLVCS